jgi:hypothetical protein
MRKERDSGLKLLVVFASSAVALSAMTRVCMAVGPGMALRLRVDISIITAWMSLGGGGGWSWSRLLRVWSDGL